MEELKLGYLKSYLERTNMKLEDCIEKLREKEEYIRSCYAETISQSSDDFVKMILVYACFIIEYFLRMRERSQWSEIDPILSKPTRVSDILLDLILLENQLPFSVLEDLFPITCFDGKYSSFLEVSTHFLKKFPNNANLKNGEFTFEYFREHHLKKKRPDGEYEEIKVLHLTDMLRICYLPCRELQPERKYGHLKQLYSASQLIEAGVKFKVGGKSLTEFQFEEGELTIPHLLVNYFFESLLRNMAALEQYHYPFQTYIGDYLVLLNLLINDSKDVDILADKRIMVNFSGDNDRVAAIVNNICQGMLFQTCNADYLLLGKNLNDFYEKPLHKYKAIFKRDYLGTPWKIASFVAATVLLFLTLIQTIFSIISKP